MRFKLKQIVMAATPLMMIGMIILIASCCDDCPTCPNGTQPYRGYLYAADYENGWVYQIDTENDSLVDSIQKSTYGSISASSDGKYLSVGNIIYDAQNLDVLTELTHGYNSVFIPDQNLYLGFMQDSVHIYSLPDFSRIFSDTITSYAFPVLDESDNRVYLHGIQTPTGWTQLI